MIPVCFLRCLWENEGWELPTLLFCWHYPPPFCPSSPIFTLSSPFPTVGDLIFANFLHFPVGHCNSNLGSSFLSFMQICQMLTAFFATFVEKDGESTVKTEFTFLLMVFYSILCPHHSQDIGFIWFRVWSLLCFGGDPERFVFRWVPLPTLLEVLQFKCK